MQRGVRRSRRDSQDSRCGKPRGLAVHPLFVHGDRRADSGDSRFREVEIRQVVRETRSRILAHAARIPANRPGRRRKEQRVFWLSSRGGRRESDATLLYKPGVGARFDIGFIGPGNTEISLDKVSRFEREMERGSKVHYMSTIVLVDRIGEQSRIAEMARAIDGDIVHMSMTYWTQEVARILERRIGFKHPITKMPAAESLRYVQTWMETADLHAVIG